MPDVPQTQPADSAAPEASPAKLHDHAMQMERHAEQLATGLARLSVDPKAVQMVRQCAEIGRKIAAGLAKQGLAGTQAAAAPPAQPQQRPTMASATADLAAQAGRRPGY